ncbi:gfo/Idh/MocA family oxidoreductase, partial [Bacteroides thetaiotaomicron]
MKSRISFFFVLLIISTSIYAQKVMRIGIIGLDTSHSTAFTELINGGSDETFSKGFRVVAAYPYGSKTIQSSYERIPGYIEKVKEQGVEIVPSIANLLTKVDCVLLETNDGRLHLEQAMEVFKAGKICYIDKPVGAT